MFNHSKKWVGHSIDGYKIISKLGEGRYGVSFLATSTLEEYVVIKRFKSMIFKLNKHKNANEAIILSQVNHPAIPKLLGVIAKKDFYVFVIKYMPGYTIEKMLFKQKYVFSYEEIMSVGYQLIQIIKYLHELGIVHRDIRTPNVVVDQGKVYLIDFGLARFFDPDCYTYELDFMYLADILLYLHYSSFEKKHSKNEPWYIELELSNEQTLLYKRLLGLEIHYSSIYEIEKDFLKAFPEFKIRLK